ncbi:uncharacterized protein LOC132564690 [Ylistrum balloti]|uniref:uncharacterized protein LOC132564690 n=1 Tax=Ylistrum balloti TaxID=509963 RepID=UPI002905989F|nr:uncharacterized protein LOC132564690 [Ylistrum balloti]
MEVLKDADEDDWLKPMKVQFIGKEGIDAGGLAREFFSLLFKNTTVFQGTTFSLNPDFLEKKTYKIIGQITAKALAQGHPGPACLNKHIVRYLLTGIDDTCTSNINLKEGELGADIDRAIKQLSEATADTVGSVFEQNASVLEATGFTKLLTLKNRDEAIKVVKAHYLLYRVMASVTQSKEGLKLGGVLEVLRRFPKDAEGVLGSGGGVTAEDIHNFYSPIYSTESTEKSKEQRIVYNLNRFLCKIEKNKISSTWLNPWHDGQDTPEDQTKAISLENVSQALIGSPRLPRDVSKGNIQFDYKSSNLSSVNTCVPFITFSNIDSIQAYEKFEEAMIFIVVGAYGFGCA